MAHESKKKSAGNDDDNRYIRFDWAAKKILRDKANFAVFEGLMTVLIGEPIKIVEILESESNQEHEHDKFNRVDIKARNSKDEIIIVEIQLTRELYYLERILYGVSKTITEHIGMGDDYDKVRKVYSINILYFDLGRGKDYLYHGTTVFKGVNTGDYLEITTKDKDALSLRTPDEIFPEYFLIRVNEFNTESATNYLEEWLDYLKNGRIREDTTAPGLQEARKKLQYLMLEPKERKAYERAMENIMYQNSVLAASHLDGWDGGLRIGFEMGIAEGRAEGCAVGHGEGGREKQLEIARRMKQLGIDMDAIVQATGLSKEAVESI